MKSDKQVPKVVYVQGKFNQALYMLGIQTLNELIIEAEMLFTEEVKTDNAQETIAVNL